jgi:hypothetical protein
LLDPSFMMTRWLQVGGVLGIVLALALIGATPSSPKVTPEVWLPEYAALLGRYATPSGVRYAAWHSSAEDRARLRKVTEQIGQTEPPTDSGAQLAFYLNAYNAWVLQRVLDVYPIAGPLAHDAAFFKQESITLCGKVSSLDYLENGIIRREFQEPRIHFALNCASKSCPPLRLQPYSGADLEDALEKQTRSYLASHEGCAEAGGKLVLSQLFEWFAGDFEKAEGSVLNFLRNHRLPEPTATEITFRPYDWNLNKAP